MTAHVPGVPDEHDEMLYGFFHLDDPRDFWPDDECSSPEEIAAHRDACERAARGEDWGPRSETHGPWVHADGRVIVGDKPSGDGWVGACHAVRSFGIGSYIVHREGDSPESLP